jgi:hypothetical protein
MKEFANITCKKKILYWLFAAVLVCSVFIAYGPSLNHVPRADQWGFLLRTMDTGNLRDMIKETYSYSRTVPLNNYFYLADNAEGGEDTFLFRPLFTILLGAERILFGNNFFFYQLVGIIIHCINVILLYMVMLLFLHHLFPSIRESKTFHVVELLPFSFALFYGLNFSLIEMVTWTHVHGYVLFTTTLLGSILFAFLYSVRDTAGVRGKLFILGAWLFAFSGAFLYDMGQLTAILIGLFLGITAYLEEKKLNKPLIIAFLFFLIPILYQTMNFIDLFSRSPALPGVAGGLLSKSMSVGTIANALRFITFTIVQPFFPSEAFIVLAFFNERITIAEPLISGNRIHSIYEQSGILNPFAPSLWLVLCSSVFILICLASLTSFKGLFKDINKRKSLICMGLLSGIIIMYTSMNVLGRMALRPGAILSANSYYAYIPLTFFLLLDFILILNGDFLKHNLNTSRGKLLSGLIVFSMILVSLFSGYAVVRRVNQEIASVYGPTHKFIEYVDKFIKDHNADNKFSFALDVAGNELNASLFRSGVPLTTILFRKYENDYNPRYVLTRRNKHLEFVPSSDFRRENGLKENDQISLQLIKYGIPYNIYRYGDEYLGVYYYFNVSLNSMLDWVGYFSPRGNYRYTVGNGLQPYLLYRAATIDGGEKLIRKNIGFVKGKEFELTNLRVLFRARDNSGLYQPNPAGYALATQ